MKFRVLVVALLFATAVEATGAAQATQVPQAAQAAPDELKKELAKIQGTWAVTTFNGETVPAEALYLVITGDKYEQWQSGSVDERGTVKLDLKTKPVSMDLVITEGNDAGKTQVGVYELAADMITMTVTLAIAGEKGRPALNQGELNIVMKKVK